MLPSSSATEVYHDLQPHNHSTFPLSYDEQFTLAAAYLASLHPPSTHFHRTAQQSQAPQLFPASFTSPSHIEDQVRSRLASLHLSTSAPSLPHSFQQQPYLSSAAHAYYPSGRSDEQLVSTVKHEAAAAMAESPWHYSLHGPVDSNASYTQQQQQHVSDMASVCAAQPHLTPSDAVTTTVSTAATTSVFTRSAHAQALASVEPLSVSPLHYPLTRLESASQCSTDSHSSYQSSLSSLHSPLSPTQPPAISLSHGESQLSGVFQPAVELYHSYSASPSTVPFAAPPPSPADGSDQPINPLRLPSFIYPVVQSAITAALHAANPPPTVSHTSAEKRKGAPFDAERRLKHRVIDANRRRRETVLLERFAQLSGQRDEPMTRDRVSTTVRMRDMAQQLQALRGTAVDSERAPTSQKVADGRGSVRKRSKSQFSPSKRQQPTQHIV